MLKQYAHLPDDLPDAVRCAAEETLAAIAEHHHPFVCRAQDALENGGRAAANAYEDAVSAFEADALNAMLCLGRRYVTELIEAPTAPPRNAPDALK